MRSDAMTDYNVMGMTALMPGIQRCIDKLVAFRDELLETINAARGASYPPSNSLTSNAQASAREFIEGFGVAPLKREGESFIVDAGQKKKRGRPKQVARAVVAAVVEAEKKFRQKSKKMKGYWASLTPEERTAEMRRRAAVAQAKRRGDNVDVNKLHPRDPRSPRHADYVKKLRKGQLNFWGKLSPEERARRVNQMQNGRAA